MSFTDNPQKKIIRQNWNTPLLRHLHDAHGVKYHYFGLPGPDIFDLRLWKDMIEKVAACERIFSDGNLYDDSNVRRLERNLAFYGFDNSEVFSGSIEEVLILGRDFNGKTLDRKVFFNLYNLDFCDTITSSIITNDRSIDKCRIGAINSLFELQHSTFNQQNKHFIILFTFRNQAKKAEINGALVNLRHREAIEFQRRCRRERSQHSARYGNKFYDERHSFWRYKVLLFDTIVGACKEHVVSVMLLPLISYHGSSDTPMMHWMVLCRAESDQKDIIISPGDFLASIYSQEVNLDDNVVQLKPHIGEAGNLKQQCNPVEQLNGVGNWIISDL